MQGLKCRRDLELGCSHISGLLIGRQMKPWALMDFRALRSDYQSGGLAGAWRQSLEAPVRPVHHQRRTTHPTQPRQERFSSVHISLCAHAVLRSALSNRGWRAGAQNCMCGYVGRAVTVTSGEQRPQYPRILVGQCDRGHVRSALGADSCPKVRPGSTRSNSTAIERKTMEADEQFSI